MALGRLIFMVVFAPLKSYALAFSLLLNILLYKKNLVVGIQFQKHPYGLYIVWALVCYTKYFVLMKISIIY